MQFQVTCSKCHKKVSTSEVRVAPDKTYICFSCAGYSGPKRDESAEPASVEKKQKSKFQCGKCKYEFYLKEGHAKKCPYCNGENITEKQFEAQKLIDMPGKYREEE